MRRSGTTETVSVTNLVTGHTCKRPSPNGKWPLSCYFIVAGGPGKHASNRLRDTHNRCSNGVAWVFAPLHSAFDVHVTIEPGVPDGGVISQRLPSGDCCGAASTRPADLGSAGRDRRRAGNLRPQNCASVIT